MFRDAHRNSHGPADPGTGRDSRIAIRAATLKDLSDNNLLGEYLRARRELVQPDSLGLPRHGIRRVAGLRREEVATLAGISSDYYLRLEQGRDRNPSVEILEAIAQVLRLDRAATEYLRGLVTQRSSQRRARATPETASAGIRQLLDVLNVPAFVEGRSFNVLAANDLARALSPNLQTGHNRLRDVFVDPAEKALITDWDQNTAKLVASFRESVGGDIDDPTVVQLVGELSLSSERFRQLWARHDVRSLEGASIRLDHPLVGDLTLRCEKLVVGGADQLLVVYHAEPGTSSAEKMARLAARLRFTTLGAGDVIAGHPVHHESGRPFPVPAPAGRAPLVQNRAPFPPTTASGSPQPRIPRLLSLRTWWSWPRPRN